MPTRGLDPARRIVRAEAGLTLGESDRAPQADGLATTMGVARYASNLGDEGDERVRAAFGENYRRLAEIKGRYDPSNLFRLNQSIRPSRHDG